MPMLLINRSAKSQGQNILVPIMLQAGVFAFFQEILKMFKLVFSYQDLDLHSYLKTV